MCVCASKECATSAEEARGEWRTKGRKGEGAGKEEQTGRRQEDRRKEENVGGMAESRGERGKSVSLGREGRGRKNTAREGLVAGRASERAIGRANACVRQDVAR